MYIFLCNCSVNVWGPYNPEEPKSNIHLRGDEGLIRVGAKGAK